MDERRRLPRKYLIIYSRVFERTLGKLLGYLADLSSNGAMIISDDPMVENEPIQLRFDLPDPHEFHTNILNVDARVARCNPDVSPEYFNIGFEFQDLTPEQSKIIERMMEVYEFRR